MIALGGHPHYCTCKRCSDKLNRDYNRAMSRRGGSGGRSQRNNGGWTPRTIGTNSEGEPVTFREGLGGNEGGTLISDGEKSDREFRREHNHYGPKREGGGRIEDDGGDRGHYTGPGS